MRNVARPSLVAGMLAMVMTATTGVTGALGLDTSRADIERRAEAAARYLVAVETAEGRFLYEFDFLLGRFTDQDNIVRQAGAGFILNQFLFHAGIPGFIEPAARSIGYYGTKSVPLADGLIVSEDGSAGGGRAGANALALLALLYHSRVTGEDFRPDLRRAWLDGLRAQQTTAGGIAQQPGDDSEDPYATGETWLALAHYRDMYPDDTAAAELLGRLEAHVLDKYLATPDRMFAHWGMMAAAWRLRTTGEVMYRDFLEQFAADYISRLVPETPEHANACSILEGLNAAAAALANGGDPTVVAALRERIERDTPASLALQLETGQTRVHFGADRFYEDPKLANFFGAFRNGALVLRTRIDFTQHCLSALLHYRDQLAAEPTSWKN